LDPLTGELNGRNHLLIAPDGGLALVPFQALPDAAGAPLVETRQIGYLATGRDALRPSDEQPAPSSPPLVIGAPDYDLMLPAEQPDLGNGLSGTPGVAAFKPLRGTAVEACEVAGALGGVRPLTGPDATKAALRRASSPRVLHIATHAFFRPAGGGRDRPDPTLVRAGLALAGANGGQDGAASGGSGGIMTAQEVANLDLRGTELVVLSACETGLGEPAIGEGVLGLGRAFTLAGASAVVMSLWKVPDSQTAQLMKWFYDYLRTSSPQTALRLAQLRVRRAYPAPFFWAAFVCHGDLGDADFNPLGEPP
jgi:CHAT domain-containing protein